MRATTSDLSDMNDTQFNEVTQNHGSERSGLMVLMQNGYKRMEMTVSRLPLLGNLYGRIFYGPLLRREAKVAGLEEGSKVVVVGSGHLPLTGIHLAKQGMRVTCIDNDPEATSSAVRYAARRSHSGELEFMTEDGIHHDYSEAEAVWVAFNVSPKEPIVRKAVEDMETGGKVIYRNPRGLLAKVYGVVSPSEIPAGHRRIRHLVGKDSLVLVNRLECDHCLRKTLCSLEEGCEGVIAAGPEDPVLRALGIRPGKTVRSLCRQPLGGPLLACVDGRKVAIDMDIARTITLV